MTARTPADRGTKILNYLAEVTVNQPHGPRPSTVYPHDKLPEIAEDKKYFIWNYAPLQATFALQGIAPDRLLQR